MRQRAPIPGSGRVRQKEIRNSACSTSSLRTVRALWSASKLFRSSESKSLFEGFFNCAAEAQEFGQISGHAWFLLLKLCEGVSPEAAGEGDPRDAPGLTAALAHGGARYHTGECSILRAASQLVARACDDPITAWEITGVAFNYESLSSLLPIDKFSEFDFTCVDLLQIH